MKSHAKSKDMLALLIYFNGSSSKERKKEKVNMEMEGYFSLV